MEQDFSLMRCVGFDCSDLDDECADHDHDHASDDDHHDHDGSGGPGVAGVPGGWLLQVQRHLGRPSIGWSFTRGS